MHCNLSHCICTHSCYLARVAIRKRRSASASPAPALGNDSQLVVRLPAALVERVDQFAERMRAELPGTRFARAEAVRVLLTRALNQTAKP
jgi:hypothetical protein